MKCKFLIFISGAIVSIFCAVQFISCSNKYDDIRLGDSKSENILQDCANIHNAGLEYIKLGAENTYGVYTVESLDSIFGEFVILQYGKDSGGRILREISSMKDLLFNGVIPSLKQTRSGETDDFTNQANPLALEALNDCMDRISVYLTKFEECEIFDNHSLLNDLHTICNETYVLYTDKCNSDIDSKALNEMFGVLNGSLEYWTNSANVEYWSNIYIKKDEENLSKNRVLSKSSNEEENNKEQLSRADFITVVASADAIGACVGAPAAGIGGAALSIAASAAAALCFDVKDDSSEEVKD